MNSDFAQHLNEPQTDTIDRLRHKLRGAHYVDVVVRKDGQDHHFECDWLRHALDILCGGPLPSRIPPGYVPPNVPDQSSKGPEHGRARSTGE